jgi:hypothetical protein
MPYRRELKSLTMALCSLLILAWLAGGAMAATGPSSYDKIETAFADGRIDHAEMLYEKALAFFAPQDLASEYKSAAPGYLKSGTELVMQIHDDWDSFSSEQQQALSAFMSRPSKQTNYNSPKGYFHIHYDTTGGEAVPPQDLDGDSIPDYVERIGVYCDSARAVYLDHMGFLPPPIDTLTGDVYDIYLQAIGGYGATIPEAPADSPWTDYTSYIIIHCRMDFNLFHNDDPEGDTIGAQKVTSAHEYFHAVQLAYKYDLSEYLWLMEASATWMEEVVFPNVNDNQNYLPDFFSVPYMKLISTMGNHEYGAFVWPGFLYQRFGPDIIRRIWLAARYNTSLAANDSALASYGSSLNRAFPEFGVWNYFTGSRAIPGRYYEEAAAYPEAPVDQAFASFVQDSVIPVHPPDALGCNYVDFTVDTSAWGNAEFILNGSNIARWAFSVDGSRADFDTVQTVISVVSEDLKIQLPFVGDYEHLIAMPMVISKSAPGNPYVLQSRVLPYGDASYDGEVNIGDAVYLITYIFKGGPAPAPLIESGDANCDGRINITDAVAIVDYVFNGGPEPCSGQ